MELIGTLFSYVSNVRRQLERDDDRGEGCKCYRNP